MKERLNAVLSGALEPNISPFLWLHGESEEKLREYMAAIYNANLRAVCLESRPHPDFLGPRWWHDLDILLDEARNRQMKVWILDDSHFPTGYAAGALERADPALCRQFLTRTVIPSGTPIPAHPAPWKPGRYESAETSRRIFEDDRVISVTELAQGKTAVCHLTRNRGPHPSYINMADAASVRVLIDTVYEPHYRRYAADFGTTIAGFFSDEPELGNDHLYEYGKRLWENDDLPWSREVESMLRDRWGDAFEGNLPLLWERDLGAAARLDYMDVLTSCVRRCFSQQIGDWCRAHGVEYIGHLIEDNNQHTRTGSSLGHYFRGLWGQDMAGIDCIGGQVYPQGECSCLNEQIGWRDGGFYHYVLGKLAASLSSLDPKKRGRAMCEIFGNYGWGEGVRLEKYLADHFLVRGINRFVPHAFSPKAFPDPDCPPHFYAHGHNPQYRHFGALMGYLGRLCALFDDGQRKVEVAIVYNAEAEWTGDCIALSELAVPLYDHQIDYDFVPADAFFSREYRLPEYRLWLIPGSQYIPAQILREMEKLRSQGKAVWFVGRRPEAVLGGGITVDVSDYPLIPIEELAQRACAVVTDRVRLVPENNRIRVLHDDDAFFLTNEGTEVYRGQIFFPVNGKPLIYNAWENTLEEAPEEFTIHPLQSLCLVFGMDDCERKPYTHLAAYESTDCSDGWRRWVCESAAYPRFRAPKEVTLPDTLAEELPAFSGFVRYEREVPVPADAASAVLEITDAHEGVELFVNGQPAGIQIIPPFRYDITALVTAGKNRLRIEVATTLERFITAGHPAGSCPSGITGAVKLLVRRKTEGKQKEFYSLWKKSEA